MLPEADVVNGVHPRHGLFATKCDARRVPAFDMPSLEARLRAKLADWRGLLHRNIAEGRAVLRTLLVSPLRFTSVKEERRRGYAFEGALALDRLLAGVVDLPTVVASPGGFEKGWSHGFREWRPDLAEVHATRIRVTAPSPLLVESPKLAAGESTEEREERMMAPVPTPGDFMETSRSEFRFLLDDFGFHEAPCSVRQERFCVRFTKDDRSVEIRGEGWGTTAACHVFCGDKGPLSLIYLGP